MGLMSLEEQVDREFATARRRAWMRKLGRLLFGKAGTGTLQSFEAVRRAVGACGGVRRGRPHCGDGTHSRQHG